MCVSLLLLVFFGFTDHFYILHQNFYYLSSKFNILVIFEKKNFKGISKMSPNLLIAFSLDWENDKTVEAKFSFQNI